MVVEFEDIFLIYAKSKLNLRGFCMTEKFSKKWEALKRSKQAAINVAIKFLN